MHPAHVEPQPAPRGAHLAHLELEKPPLLLHLFSDFSPADFGANHPMQLGVLLLFLLNFGSAAGKARMSRDASGTALQTTQAAGIPLPGLQHKRAGVFWK